MNELAALVGAKRFRFDQRHPADYPYRLYIRLAEVAGCSLARLQSTTFFHLGEHFGMPSYSPLLHRFLRTSLAGSLRYCPCCLAQHALPYYSLIWRFSEVAGCIEHHCMLLNYCGHCGSSLPLFVRFPQLARCPGCQGDLRTCQSAHLPQELLKTTRRRTADLEMLLTPVQWTAEDAQAKVIGKHLAYLRQQRKLSIAEVAHRMRATEHVVLDIEHTNWYTEALFNHALLNHYVQYADALDISLREIFERDALQTHLASISEEQILEQAKAAIWQLQAQGEPVTQGNVGSIVGISAPHLKQYPRVHLLLSTHKKRQREAS